MKVVIADRAMSWYASLIELLTGPGVEFVVRPDAAPEELAILLADADALIGAYFNPALAQAAPRLRLLQLVGAGYDHLDLDTLPDRIAVANTYFHERAIAEYILMAMIALARSLPQADTHLRQGIWDSPLVDPTVPMPLTLRSRTVGLLGYGHIAREVVRVCRPLEVRFRAVTRRPDPALAAQDGLEAIGGPADLPDLLRRTDFLVITVPLSEATRGMIGAEELALLPAAACLINVARGPVVDERALYEALAAGRIAGAALDVWYNYPADGVTRTLPSAYPFHQLNNVLLSPHISGVAYETFEARARFAADNLRRLAAGEPLLNVIHPRPAA